MNTETLTTKSGQAFRVTFERDDCMAEPWREHDGHGVVSGWTRDDKHPYEMLLSEDHGMKRYYNFKASVARARNDGWNTEPYIFKTAGEQAHHAAMADFKHLKAWCDDDWWWSCLKVVLLDIDGEEMEEYTDYLGGVEDGYSTKQHNYATDCAQEMAEELEWQLKADNEAAQVAALREIKDNALYCAGVI